MHELDYLLKQFDSKESQFANKALDFLDGKQLTHMVEILNHPSQGRRNWQERGMRAIYRNIVGKIIEKSGLLFINGRPDISVIKEDGSVDDRTTEMLHAYLDIADFAVVGENLDQVVRLVKTAIVLCQYDSETEEMFLDILHRGNCAVDYNRATRKIAKLCYKYPLCDETGKCGYRVFTDDVIEDWEERDNKIVKVATQPNTYGHIPATVFYDTKVPRSGFWADVPKDLVLMNEEYNLYLIDTMFAASYANRKTLFTNASFDGDNSESLRVEEHYQSPLPRQTSGVGGESISGPDKVIQLDTTGLDNVFLEYKGPDIKLAEIKEFFSSLIRDIAEDWSVRIKMDGEGAANSGFQVIVEEIDNLELRKQRQRMMEVGLRKMFRCIAAVVNSSFSSTRPFNEESYIDVEFPDPNLPVDIKEEDAMWIQRIEKGLASRVDYFMSMKGMSQEEAELEVERLRSTGSLHITPEEHKILLEALLSKAISHQTYLEKLKEGGLLSKDRDINLEMSMIDVDDIDLDE